ncbi:MAG: (2Fe-2S)-binding protein [Thermoanaerobaculia bacterium]|nr:(2Fe-2S)-binding protein [Thermoanaerobaculia bacterium]
MSDSDGKRSGISRRGFIKGAGLSAAGAALSHASVTTAEAAAQGVREGKVLGPGPVAIELMVNGRRQILEVEPRATLADAIRDEIGLTGTKVSCNRGACSACTVFLDGRPVSSCMTLAVDAGDREITTIEGLAKSGKLHPVQKAFVDSDAMQCGFCTPGMVMSAAALLSRNPDPTLDEVREATSGNLCRCGTYPKVFEATLAAAKKKEA